MAKSDSYKNIGEYGIIGNTKTAALVGIDGSIDWCCLPSFHSPAAFASLLDHESGGCFELSLADGSPVRQEYEPNTNVLRTVLHSDEGTIQIHDFMPCFMDRGELVVRSEIVRLVRCLDGTPTLEVAFEPKFDFGRTETTLMASNESYRATNGDSTLTLRTEMDLETNDGILSGQWEFDHSEKLWFVCRYADTEIDMDDGREDPLEKLEWTRRYWRNWCGRCTYRGRWPKHVFRSALVLRLLTSESTGATVAAATTSLPEKTGGTRNWDYRYSWIRDSIFSAWSFHEVGYYELGIRFVDLLEQVIDPQRVPVLVDVEGNAVPTVQQLDQFEGYRGSTPVRIGNDAAEQVQWGSYGALVDGVYFSHRELGGIDTELYENLVRPVVNYISGMWQNPDHGIWEVQGEKQHFVTSKVWCWVVLDRGIKMAKEKGYWEDVGHWNPHRETIRNDILEKGWSDDLNAFKIAYDCEALDASVLLMPLVGFLSAEHPKMKRTIETLIDELGEDGLLYRYRPESVTSDPIESDDALFTTCSFWLVTCLARRGEINRARDLFEELLDYSNHLGLYSEELNPETGTQLGNFPQAYVHMGLINAAVELHRALG